MLGDESMKPTALLFDLDGTITDSAEGIIHSVRYALNKQGKEIPDDCQLTSFIGPPLAESFQTVCQLKEEEIAQAILDYREYYQKKGLFESQLYPDIPKLLAALQQLNLPLYVATSKPEKFARQLLAHYHLTDYFGGIYGASLDGTRAKKSTVIAYALEQAEIDPTETTIMIGDRSHDILGASENGLKSIGVLYGFGTSEELRKAGADKLVSSPLEILSCITEK